VIRGRTPGRRYSLPREPGAQAASLSCSLTDLSVVCQTVTANARRSSCADRINEDGHRARGPLPARERRRSRRQTLAEVPRLVRTRAAELRAWRIGTSLRGYKIPFEYAAFAAITETPAEARIGYRSDERAEHFRAVGGTAVGAASTPEDCEAFRNEATGAGASASSGTGPVSRRARRSRGRARGEAVPCKPLRASRRRAIIALVQGGLSTGWSSSHARRSSLSPRATFETARYTSRQRLANYGAEIRRVVQCGDPPSHSPKRLSTGCTRAFATPRRARRRSEGARGIADVLKHRPLGQTVGYQSAHRSRKRTE